MGSEIPLENLGQIPRCWHKNKHDPSAPGSAVPHALAGHRRGVQPNQFQIPHTAQLPSRRLKATVNNESDSPGGAWTCTNNAMSEG